MHRNLKLGQALIVYAYLARARKGFKFDPKRGEYINNANGTIVKQDALETEIDAYIGYVGDNIAFQTQRLVDGKISIPAWQRAMRKEMRDSWRTQYILGAGGVEQMTQADWGRIGGRLNQQYKYLNGFADAIVDADFTDDKEAKKILDRASMYADARTSFYDGRTSVKKRADFKEERRVLIANDKNNCANCEEFASRGWVKIGTLPEPGQGSQCLTRCRCDKEYR